MYSSRVILLFFTMNHGLNDLLAWPLRARFDDD